MTTILKYAIALWTMVAGCSLLLWMSQDSPRLRDALRGPLLWILVAVAVALWVGATFSLLPFMTRRRRP